MHHVLIWNPYSIRNPYYILSFSYYCTVWHDPGLLPWARLLRLVTESVGNLESFGTITRVEQGSCDCRLQDPHH